MGECRTPEEWIARAREHWDLPENGDKVIVVPTYAQVLRVVRPGEKTEIIDTMEVFDEQGRPLMGYGPESRILAVHVHLSET